MSQAIKPLDARGCPCPEPVLIVKRELEKHPSVFSILVDQPAALENITRFLRNHPYEAAVSRDDQGILITISKA